MTSEEPEAQPAPDPVAELEPVAPARTRHPVFGIVGVVVVVAALIAGSVAFAGGKQFASPTVDLSAAAGRTTGSGTARVSFSGSVTFAGKTINIASGEGANDYDTKATALTLKIGRTTTQIRAMRGVAYFSLPSAALPRGAHWVSLTAADLHLESAARDALGANDPTQGLKFLSAINGSPRVVGHEDLDGAPVTHYEFTLDLKALFDRLGAASDALKSSSFATGLQSLGSLVDLTAIPGEAWIDTDGRVRRFKMTIGIEMGGESAKAVDEFAFSHFGEPVEVEAPPASDTVPFRDVPDLFSQIGSSAGPAIDG